MRRLRLVLEYDGTEFHGFQRQAGLPTVQAEIESRLGGACGQAVEVVAAGRTDAGVHALGQVLHFDTSGGIPADRLPMAVNGGASRPLRITHVEETGADFHARFSAQSRTYRYYLAPQPVSPTLSRYVLHAPRLLRDGLERMARALPALLGTWDFRSFSQEGESSRSTVRTILSAGLHELDGIARVTLQADAFLWRMVRRIVGELVAIGRGKSEPEELRLRLCGEIQKPLGAAVPPHGLFLCHVGYPDGYPGWPEGRDLLTSRAIWGEVRGDPSKGKEAG